MNQSISRIEELARVDQVAAPLAVLVAESLRAASSDSWPRAVPDFTRVSLGDGSPLLAGATISLDPQPVHELLDALFGHTVASGAILDPMALLQASINQDADRLAALAVESGTEAGLLATLGQLAALPLLRACGDKAERLLHGSPWDRGYCPVCGAWPTLAEVRGAERERWLRCGRCGAGWRRLHVTCAFCGNSDHATQGYLAPEDQMESRQATTCERCRGYLKSVASPFAMDPAELFLKDLATLELDMAAIERGYSRPATPGYALDVRISSIT